MSTHFSGRVQEQQILVESSGSRQYYFSPVSYFPPLLLSDWICLTASRPPLPCSSSLTVDQTPVSCCSSHDLYTESLWDPPYKKRIPHIHQTATSLLCLWWVLRERIRRGNSPCQFLVVLLQKAQQETTAETFAVDKLLARFSPFRE